MISSKPDLALNKLLAFTPLQEASRKTPIQKTLAELVRLAAAFEEELDQEGRGDDLLQCATTFESLTATESSFDAARSVAHAELDRGGPGFYLPDRSAQPIGRRHLIVDSDLTFSGQHLYPNYLWKVKARLDDVDHTRWNLPEALEDVDHILTLDLSSSQHQVFKNWRQAVWDLTCRSDREHLFGSYLLNSCHKAIPTGSSDPDNYQVLLRRLAEDPVRLTKLIHDAAEYLSVYEPRPAEFCSPPLTGTLMDLAGWICPVYRREPDTRTVKPLHKKDLWLERCAGKLWKVYFKDQKTYAEAHSNELKANEQKANEQKASEQKASKRKASKQKAKRTS